MMNTTQESVHVNGKPAEDTRGASISVSRASHEFPSLSGDYRPVLRDVSFTIKPGQFASIIGPSGCGKTTVLNLLAGLETPQEGEFSILGKPPAAGRPDVSMSFARDALLPWYTAIDNVALPLELRGMRKTERRKIAAETLQRVGLGEFTSAYRSHLSQGMRQRVALSRALVTRPNLLLLDEPFAALDSQTRVVIQDELIKMLASQGEPVTTLMVTHDLGEAVALSDVVILMSSRPATIRKIYEVDLPRPRDAIALRADSRYLEIYEEIWSALSEEVTREGN